MDEIEWEKLNKGEVKPRKPLHHHQRGTKSSRSKRFGPRIKIKDNAQTIPLGKASSHLAEISQTTLDHQPPAWKVETTPHITLRPRNANYYRTTFNNAIIRRHSWQYMFGGLLRAAQGIYSHSRYWDREVELSLQQELKADYEESKRKGRYGIYQFEVIQGGKMRGYLWKDDQAPDNHWLKRKNLYFRLKTGGVFFARVNRVDFSHEWKSGYVDIEAKPKYKGGELMIIRIHWKMFKFWLSNGRIRRIPEEIFPHVKVTQYKKTRLFQPTRRADPLPLRGL